MDASRLWRVLYDLDQGWNSRASDLDQRIHRQITDHAIFIAQRPDQRLDRAFVWSGCQAEGGTLTHFGGGIVQKRDQPLRPGVRRLSEDAQSPPALVCICGMR